MDRKKISILLALTLLLTGTIGTRSGLASERPDVISEVLETVPADNEGLTESDETEDASGTGDGVVSETLKTTPVTDGNTDETDDSGSRPDGVVQMVVRTTPVDENGNEAAGTGTYEVTGRSSTPDESELGLYAADVVNMVMPVVQDETYDFVMDSQDLLSRYSVYKDSYEKSSLYFTNSTGPKAHTGISDVAMAKNKSSVPVLLYVTLQVENEYGWPVKYTDMDSVESDNEMNVSFALIPVSADADDDISGETGENEDYKVFEDRKVSIDDTGKAEMILYLPGTPDNFDLINNKYMAKEDAVWSSLGFAVTGACNTRADWSPIDGRSDAGEALGIHISFRMDLLSDEQKELIDNGAAPDPETGVIIFDTKSDENDNTEDKEEVDEAITEDREKTGDEVSDRGSEDALMEEQREYTNDGEELTDEF